VTTTPATARSAVRAVVCDDSPFMRRFLSAALERGGVDVVGAASSGQEGLDACAALRPDVLTLDMQMPGLSGLDVLRRIPADGPRVVVVSAHTEEGSTLALDALAEGAVDVVLKPGVHTPLDVFAAGLARTVRTAASARRVAALAPRTASTAPPAPPVATVAGRLNAPLVVIACSTGGPRALATLLPQLRAPLGCGGVIVQHMPAGYTATLAKRLDASSTLTVREAQDGDAIRPDTLLLAPGDLHLHVERGVIRLGREEPVGALRPRADLTFADAARVYGRNVVGVVLTGMGSDGVAGLRAVKAAGGLCLAEAEQSCVVYGMPRAVAEAGLADAVHPLDAIPAALHATLAR
jgi:two-component system chemotaxis response regulator CheB